MAVEGVDGCWVGPGDLGLTMGVDLSTAEGRAAHEKAILGVLDVCRRLGKIPGIAGTPQNARYWLDKGFLFVTVGGETSLLASICTEVLQSLR